MSTGTYTYLLPGISEIAQGIVVLCFHKTIRAAPKYTKNSGSVAIARLCVIQQLQMAMCAVCLKGRPKRTTVSRTTSTVLQYSTIMLLFK